MTDAERDEYEARMQAQWEKKHTCTYPPLRRSLSAGVLGDPLFMGHSHVGCNCKSPQSNAGAPAELGFLVDPGHDVLSYSNLGKPGWGGGVVVMGGDFRTAWHQRFRISPVTDWSSCRTCMSPPAVGRSVVKECSFMACAMTADPPNSLDLFALSR